MRLRLEVCCVCGLLCGVVRLRSIPATHVPRSRAPPDTSSETSGTLLRAFPLTGQSSAMANMSPWVGLGSTTDVASASVAASILGVFGEPLFVPSVCVRPTLLRIAFLRMQVGIAPVCLCALLY
jgi:hypothetical protein